MSARQIAAQTARTPGTIPCTECGTPTSMLGTRLCDGCYELKRNGKYDALKSAHDDLVAALKRIPGLPFFEQLEIARAALAKAGAL